MPDKETSPRWQGEAFDANLKYTVPAPIARLLFEIDPRKRHAVRLLSERLTLEARELKLLDEIEGLIDAKNKNALFEKIADVPASVLRARLEELEGDEGLEEAADEALGGGE